MTKGNNRFIRKMQTGVRIRRVTEGNIGKYKGLISSSSQVLSEFYVDTTYEMFGIEQASEPKGIICLSKGREMIEVLWLLVDPMERRLGYGSELLIKAKELAIELGFDYVGASYPENASDEEVPALDSFFTQNGFFRTDELSEGEPAVICDLVSEIEEVSEDEEDDLSDMAQDVPPMAALFIERLQRLKEALEVDGTDAEVILGEKAFLWADQGESDVQITITARNAAFEVLAISFSTLIQSDKDPKELSEFAVNFNIMGYLPTAVATEDGIVLNYMMLESGFPVDERVFLATFSEFRESVIDVSARLG